MLQTELKRRRKLRPRRDSNAPAVVIGYVRVSTSEQADSGAGLDSQRTAILAEASRRGWSSVNMIEDAGWSAKNLKRPGIQSALGMLRTGKASVLIVAKLDRLSRSVADFANLTNRADKEGWSLVALDIGIDMTTPTGKLMASMLSVLSEWERDIIKQRTRDAMAALKAQGRPVSRPGLSSPVRDYLRQMANAGNSAEAIADKLNADAVPTARGGVRWYPSTVRAALAVKP